MTSPPSLPPFASHATPPGRDTLLLDAGSALAAAVGIVAAALAFSGMWDRMAGEQNQSAFLPYLRLRATLVLTTMACLAFLSVRLAVLVARGGGDRRPRAAGIALLIGAVTLAPMFIALRTKQPAWQRYADGFQRFAQREVDVEAIRAWHATLPAAPAAAPVPPAQWPPEVVVLQPANVEAVANAGGIVLQWGRLAAWGDSRKIFIAPDDHHPPPEDIHHPWTQVSPGLHAAPQVPG